MCQVCNTTCTVSEQIIGASPDFWNTHSLAKTLREDSSSPLARRRRKSIDLLARLDSSIHALSWFWLTKGENEANWVDDLPTMPRFGLWYGGRESSPWSHQSSLCFSHVNKPRRIRTRGGSANTRGFRIGAYAIGSKKEHFLKHCLFRKWKSQTNLIREIGQDPITSG